MIASRATIAAGLAFAFTAQAARSASPECRSGPTRQAALSVLGERGEMVLSSGERVVLDGIRWPTEDERVARDWMLRHRGRILTILPRGEPDRWGRTHVDAAIADEAVDLAGGLIAEGLVHVDAGERDILCRPALFELESGARSSGLGIWKTGVHEGKDGASLRPAMGRFVVVQGQVLSVGERSSRTYIDFARRGEDGLTVTVSKRTWRQLRERGLSAATLKGQHVRVRGVLESWRGPTLDIASADMIELLDGERALRR